MKRHPFAVGLFAFGMAFAGCGDPLGPNALLLADSSLLPMAEQPLMSGQVALRVAAVGTLADSAIVDVPRGARVGEPVQLRVTTYAGGCIAEDTTAVRVSGREVVVVPYQKVRTGGICTADLRITQRVATVVFNSAGLAVVTVIGRSGPRGGLMKFVRLVTVRE